jgi:N-acyl-D-amino-acid deacylase
MFSILIKNGFIVDGSGKERYKGNVGIKNNIIEYIGEKVNLLKGNIEIDAKNKIICPGFIDMHSHADLAILRDPLCKDKIQQGITTQVIGNCGQSIAPLIERTIPLLKKYVTPLLGDIKTEWEWRSFKEYLSLIQKKGIATNIVPLVGHLTLKVSIMGFENRKPFVEELEKIKLLVIEAMESGAFGISTGLTYPPDCYSTTEELIKICKVVKQYGGIYASHARVFSSVKKAVEEAIEIGENAGIPIEISHLQISDKIQGETIQDTFQLIDNAIERGIDITFDQYPYEASSGLVADIFPASLMYKGNIEDTAKYLSNKIVQKTLIKQLEKTKINWDNIIITSSLSNKNRHLERNSIKTIALLKGKPPLQVFFELLIEEKMSIIGIFFGKKEKDLSRIVKHSSSLVGTDGLYNSGKIHPRSYGTFPRILRKYVKEEKVLTMEEAIKKMTYLPAKKLDLRNRGKIEKGMIADLVVFDPLKIEDMASYEYPVKQSRGIEYVIIGGKIVLDKGRNERVFAGEVLKRM